MALQRQERLEKEDVYEVPQRERERERRAPPQQV